MPVPGYDPEDIDDALEGERLEASLSESELEAYRNGDAELIDLLSEDEIRRLIDDESGPD
ncbi:hypothetical protein [Halopiger djelfimassiliensis]|uniref:hypothetical protein n=1 Tax=Halopiger djelfimassiliensis TaxID=1293047 RepID=UPI000677C916|nr:hypothetical protein [Halopiger djelfimassiliensis]